MLLCGLFWHSTRNHYLLVLVTRALATSISMYVRPDRNSVNKCTTIIPTAVPWGFFHSVICFGTKYYANLEIMSCQVLFINLSITGEYRSKYIFCAFLACLALHPSTFTSRCGTDKATLSEGKNNNNKAGRGALEPPPEDGARTKRFYREIPVPRTIYRGRDEKNS